MHKKTIEYKGIKLGLIEKLDADGSDRLFFRVEWNYGTSILIRPSLGEVGKREALSYLTIGSHLHKKGISLPKIHDHDPNTGDIIVEDLGNNRLFDCYQETKGDSEGFNKIISHVISELVRFQLLGREEFDPKWCYDTSKYDKEFVLGREIRYFINSFLIGFMKFNGNYLERLEDELKCVLNRLDDICCEYLMHRDFQSRNIMIKDSKVFIIDFQGARLGPLCYDIASLIIDPYIGINVNRWDFLLDEYVYELEKNGHHVTPNFRNEFYILSLFRNLQILGAFSYLYRIKGKTFFKGYIKKALLTLSYLVEHTKLPLDELRKILDLTLGKIDFVLQNE